MYWLMIMHNYYIVLAFSAVWLCLCYFRVVTHIDHWCMQTASLHTMTWCPTTYPSTTDIQYCYVVIDLCSLTKRSDCSLTCCKANWTLVVCVVHPYDRIYALICIHMHTLPTHFVHVYSRLFSCLTSLSLLAFVLILPLTLIQTEAHWKKEFTLTIFTSAQTSHY